MQGNDQNKKNCAVHTKRPTIRNMKISALIIFSCLVKWNIDSSDNRHVASASSFLVRSAARNVVNKRGMTTTRREREGSITSTGITRDWKRWDQDTLRHGTMGVSCHFSSLISSPSSSSLCMFRSEACSSGKWNQFPSYSSTVRRTLQRRYQTGPKLNRILRRNSVPREMDGAASDVLTEEIDYDLDLNLDLNLDNLDYRNGTDTMDGNMGEEEEEEDGEETSKRSPRREIHVSASIELPFSAEVAFDAFADLPRQPSWSSWLRSVSYIDDDVDDAINHDNDDDDDDSNVRSSLSPIPLRRTRWTMAWRRLTFSWIARSTLLDRPRRIDWESTSGLRNRGSVKFVPLPVAVPVDDHQGVDVVDSGDGATNTLMTLSMTFVAPRIVAALVKRSDKISRLVEDRMLEPTLVGFRRVVMEEDLGISHHDSCH